MRGTFAWLLATCPVDEIRDGARAVELARQVVEASPGDPWALDTLAAAYAESGDFESALRTAQNGLDLARTAGQAELTAAIQGRMAGYREGRPHREAVEPAGGAPGN
jgi:cytochrome c-type biogenesis protein CcmH/NrfG